MISAYHEHPHNEREQALTRALRESDPEAVVSIDPDGGQLSISTALPEREVLAILGSVGVDAAPAQSTHGDETGGCCGGCS